MPRHLVTFEPEDVRYDDPSDALPDWALLVVDRIREAAASGQTVTVVSEERMLSPEQMARRMSLHRSTVVRKIECGEIQATKVGNRHRIPYSEFLRYQEATLGGAAPPAAPAAGPELLDR